MRVLARELKARAREMKVKAQELKVKAQEMKVKARGMKVKARGMKAKARGMKAKALEMKARALETSMATWMAKATSWVKAQATARLCREARPQHCRRLRHRRRSMPPDRKGMRATGGEDEFAMSRARLLGWTYICSRKTG